MIPAASFSLMKHPIDIPPGRCKLTSPGALRKRCPTRFTKITKQTECSWLEPYDAGRVPTAHYKVIVPGDIEEETYTFPDGSLLYYIVPNQAEPYEAAIEGEYEVEVVAEHDEETSPVPPPVGGTAHALSMLASLASSIALDAGIIAGASLLVLRHRSKGPGHTKAWNCTIA